jgi:hypothetical protein
MCVFVENAGFGGAIAAPIAHKLFDAFFHAEKYDEYMGNPLKPKVKTDSLSVNTDSLQAYLR